MKKTKKKNLTKTQLYFKEYYLKNKEKMKEYSNNYYATHKDERRAKMREGKEEYYGYKDRVRTLLHQLEDLRKENIQLLRELRQAVENNNLN